MGKKNTTGTFVHVPREGSQQNVYAVAPGDDFPDDTDFDRLDPAVYADDGADDDDEVEAAGPGQRPGEGVASAPANEEWKGVTVPQLRDRLGDAADASDRKDALVEKAVAAGLTPDDFGGGE
jgi:hypothetical protein